MTHVDAETDRVFEGFGPAYPVLLRANAPRFTGTLLFSPRIPFDYSESDKTLYLQSRSSVVQLELSGVSCEALLLEAIAAGVLTKCEKSYMGKFTPHKQTNLESFSRARPIGAGLLRAEMSKLVVQDHGVLDVFPLGSPIHGYLGIFRTDRKHTEHQLFRLSTLVACDKFDARLDIVVRISEVLFALTQVGYLRRLSVINGSASDGMMRVQIPDRSMWLAASDHRLVH
ncbi:MAG: hypothetical protein Q8P30_00090 [Candidatus Uhrbacteria bacterium]|nr:hypothetical protein [Candidatus Uhrbacteria bacterium]